MQTSTFSTRQWQNILSSLPSGLIIFEASSGKITVISDLAAEMLKLTEAHASWHTWPTPLYEFRLALEGPFLRRGEVTIPWPEAPRTLGYSLSGLSDYHPEFGENNRVCLFSDITNVIQDRLALDQLKENLYEIKNQSTQQTLVSATVHEMENPIMTLFLELSCLESEVLAGKDQDKEYLRIITLDRIDALTRHTQHIGALLSQLQHLAEMPALNLQPVHVAHVVTDLFQQLPKLPRFELTELRHELNEVASCPILVDRLCLEQLLFNLVQHVLDFTPDQTRPSVLVTGKRMGAMIYLSLRYQGLPMHPGIVTAFKQQDIIPEPRLSLCGALGKRLTTRLTLEVSELEGGREEATFQMGWPIHHEAHEGGKA